MGVMSSTNDYIHTSSILAYDPSNGPVIQLFYKGFRQANITTSTFPTYKCLLCWYLIITPRVYEWNERGTARNLPVGK